MWLVNGIFVLVVATRHYCEHVVQFSFVQFAKKHYVKSTEIAVDAIISRMEIFVQVVDAIISKHIIQFSAVQFTNTLFNLRRNIT